jgi:hypothetical protein
MKVYDEFKVHPDEQLLSEWEATTTGADIHDHNQFRTCYLYFCKVGQQEKIDKWERLMRAELGKRKLKALGR